MPADPRGLTDEEILRLASDEGFTAKIDTVKAESERMIRYTHRIKRIVAERERQRAVPMLSAVARITDAGAVDVWEETFGHWHGSEERIGVYARQIEMLVLERVQDAILRDDGADGVKGGERG